MDRTNASRFAVSTAVAMIIGTAAQAQNAPADAAALEEVVVTGSLIQRPNNTAVSPILSVSDVALEESGQPRTHAFDMASLRRAGTEVLANDLADGVPALA